MKLILCSLTSMLINTHAQATEHIARHYDFSYTPPLPSEWKQDKESEDVSNRLANSTKKVELNLKPSKEDTLHKDAHVTIPFYFKNQADRATGEHLKMLKGLDCHGNQACLNATERSERIIQRLRDKKQNE